MQIPNIEPYWGYELKKAGKRIASTSGENFQRAFQSCYQTVTLGLPLAL